LPPAAQATDISSADLFNRLSENRFLRKSFKTTAARHYMEK
jgi:hypothetical protein